MSLEQRVVQHIQHSIAQLRDCQHQLPAQTAAAATLIANALLSGGKVITAGSGASIALAQYLTSLLTVRYQRERPGLPALTLGADSVTVLTVTAESQHRDIFTSQLRVLAQPADVVVLFCAGAEQAALRNVIETAKDRALPVVLIHHEDSAALAELLQSADVALCSPTPSGARTQEVHLILTHCLCDLIDVQIFGDEL